MVKFAVVLSLLVGVAWLALVVYTFSSAARMEPGFSMAPANLGFETIAAVSALAVIWGLLLGVRFILRLGREIRREPSTADRRTLGLW